MGTVVAARIGGHEGRWDAVLGGPGLRELGPILSACAIDEVRMSAGARALLGPDAAVTPAGEFGTAGLTACPDPSVELSSIAAALAPSTGDYVAHVVRRRIAGGTGDDWMGELRALTVLFCSLDGLDDSDDGFDRLGQATRLIQASIHRCFGEFDKVSIDDKGTIAIAAFGLPTGGGAYRADLAVTAALRIQRDLASLNVRSSIGVATGRVFCGPVGGVSRREYTVMGNAVNRAARLMSKADGAVLCDPATHTAARQAVEFEPAGEVSLKGFDAPVVLHRALRPADPELAADHSAFVGRQRERASLLEVLDVLGDGGGPIASLVGEAGIGKSRLAAEIGREASSRGIRTLVMAAEAAAQDTPWHAWKGPTLRLLGADGLAGEPLVASVIEGLDEDLRPRAALLGPVLGLDLPDGEQTADLQGRARADATTALLGEIVRRREGERLLLIVEDVHWLDERSAELLAGLAGSSSLGLLLTSRPPDDTAPPPVHDLMDLSASHRIDVAELGGVAVARLIAARLGVAAVPVRLAGWVLARAHGNPFFVVQITEALALQGVLKVVDGCLVEVPSDQALDAVAPPTSVEGTVSWRLDRLDERAQVVLKRASVLGFRFPRAAMAAFDTEPPVHELELLLAADVLVDLGPQLGFRHRITQEVAYGLVPPATRRSLHGGVAEWLGTEVARAEGERWPELARHWSLSDSPERAIVPLERAADDAWKAGLAAQAFLCWDRAAGLADGPASELVSPHQVARWHRGMAEAAAGMGEPDQVQLHARAALALLGSAAPTDARGWKLLGLRALLGHIAHRVLPAPFWRARVEDREPLRDATRAFGRLAEAFFHQAGDRVALIVATLETANLAERSDAPQHATNAYGTLGMVAGMLGKPGLADYYLRLAKEGADRSGDPRRLAEAWFAAVLVRSGAGDWDLVDEAREGCLPILRASRNDYLLGPLLSVSALNAYLTGDYVRAGEWADELRVVGERHDSERYIGWSAYQHAKVCNALGRFDEALVHGVEARARLAAIHDVSQVTAEAVVAVAQVRLGHHEESRAAADALVAMLNASPASSYTRLEGYAGPAEVYAELLDAPDADVEALAAGARASLVPLAGFAKRFPLGRSRHLHLDARIRRALGDDVGDQLDRALVEAERMMFRCEAARIHECLARGTHLGSTDRSEHLDAARRGFVALGGGWFLDRLEHRFSGEFSPA